MYREVITSALGASGKIVPIESAISGERYVGATPHHRNCELYPVFRQSKRASFVHMPRQSMHGRRGESDAHSEAIKSWMRFFNTQLGECPACLLEGVDSAEHICSEYRLHGKPHNSLLSSNRLYGEIVWTCDRCLRVHMWDLLDCAISVVSNKRVPGLGSRVRPDITILGEGNRALALLEFRKSHLSDTVRQVARESNIPLFVIDIGESPSEFIAGINNPRRGVWESTEMSETNRRIAEDSFRFRESVAKEGGVASEFAALPDNDGNLADVLFHASGRSSALPQPSIGMYLMASESSLKCESQKRWLAPDVSPS